MDSLKAINLFLNTKRANAQKLMRHLMKQLMGINGEIMEKYFLLPSSKIFLATQVPSKSKNVG